MTRTKLEIDCERGVLQELARDLLAVYAPLDAGLWLSAPHAMLGDRTPFEAMEAGDGHKVMELLDQLATGAYI